MLTLSKGNEYLLCEGCVVECIKENASTDNPVYEIAGIEPAEEAA